MGRHLAAAGRVACRLGRSWQCGLDGLVSGGGGDVAALLGSRAFSNRNQLIQVGHLSARCKGKWKTIKIEREESCAWGFFFL